MAVYPAEMSAGVMLAKQSVFLTTPPQPRLRLGIPLLG